MIILVAAGFIACNNSASESELKDPSTVQPPSDAIHDLTEIVNDSVIVADTTPKNGRQEGKSDSIKKQTLTTNKKRNFITTTRKIVIKNQLL